MSRGAFNTLVVLDDGETEIEVRVIYSRYAGFPGSMEEPPEPASVEITSIKPCNPEDSLPLDFDGGDGLIAECMADWADDEINAAEWRAECRRDDLLMEKF